MSLKNKYIKKDFFNQFKKEVSQEKKKGEGFENSDNKFPNPTPGYEYKIRFLPDATGEAFYKKFYYHMYQIDGAWKFSLCPKTLNMDSYCPCCAVAAKLYKSGTESDKAEAGRFKRKEKFVANIFVVNDPRDQDKDEDNKISGTIKIFEFATKLESNIRVGVFDEENGVGPSGFDPTDDGINFVIRVTETKPQADGKTWPDYATSSFARNASAIVDSEKEVDDLMTKVIDLNEYLKKQLPDDTKIIDDLKAEEIYDLISEEHGRILAKRSTKKEETPLKSAKDNTKSTYSEKTDLVEDVEEEPESKKTSTKKSDSELDDDLLNELNSL